jgi:hypothetical protein
MLACLYRKRWDQIHQTSGNFCLSNERREKMSKDVNIRWGWLKLMYILTIVVAGISGLGVILFPSVMSLRMPKQDPVVFGITGSVYLAFAILSILGLRSPLKFAPVLLLQLCYKVTWLIGVIFPLLFSGLFPTYAIPSVVIFVIFIIGDLIAIPFSYVFAKETDH